MSLYDALLIGFTALVGLFCGAYVYVTVFAPAYVESKPDLQLNESLTLIGEMYGGCSRIGCPTFRLTGDRKFQYLPGSTTAGGSTEGRYPRVEYAKIFDILKAANLNQLAQTRSLSDCSSFSDGIDFRYSITLEGSTFELDTCTTALSENKALQQALERVFVVVEDPEAYAYDAADYQQAGVLGYLLPSWFYKQVEAAE